MAPRRGLLLAGTLGLLAACGLAFLALTPRPRITRETYGRIREGLTEEEVKVIFGGPPGNYIGKDPDWLVSMAEINMAIEQASWEAARELCREWGEEPPPPQEEFVTRLWVGEELAVLVCFRSGEVVRWFEQSVADQNFPWLRRLRRLLHI